jgi:hypothetical protein
MLKPMVEIPREACTLKYFVLSLRRVYACLLSDFGTDIANDIEARDVETRGKDSQASRHGEIFYTWPTQNLRMSSFRFRD